MTDESSTAKGLTTLGHPKNGCKEGFRSTKPRLASYPQSLWITLWRKLGKPGAAGGGGRPQRIVQSVTSPTAGTQPAGLTFGSGSGGLGLGCCCLGETGARLLALLLFHAQLGDLAQALDHPGVQAAFGEAALLVDGADVETGQQTQRSIHVTHRVAVELAVQHRLQHAPVQNQVA